MLGGTCDVRQILFLPLGIFDSYVSLIQNKIFFGTLRRISDLTNLAVTSWAFSCLLSPGPYGMVVCVKKEVFFGAAVRGRTSRQNWNKRAAAAALRCWSSRSVRDDGEITVR
jgi:hypothetical protein